MFAVVYVFQVKEGSHLLFRTAWRRLTELIYECEGSLGARLHQTAPAEYLAYAHWPSKEAWEQSWGRLPAEAQTLRRQMHESCTHIETRYEMEVVDDFLQREARPVRSEWREDGWQKGHRDLP